MIRLASNSLSATQSLSLSHTDILLRQPDLRPCHRNKRLPFSSLFNLLLYFSAFSSKDAQPEVGLIRNVRSLLRHLDKTHSAWLKPTTSGQDKTGQDKTRDLLRDIAATFQTQRRAPKSDALLKAFQSFAIYNPSKRRIFHRLFDLRMLPPPGFEPALTSLENATPTTLISSAVATASSLLNIGVEMPSSTLSSIITIATAIATTPEEPPPDADNGECRLLGPFAIIVQGALGLLALLALVYKRWRERPQRPLKIWFFDVSKQVVGSVLVHIANLLMSMLSSGQLSIKLDANAVSGRGLGRLAMLGARDVDAQGKYRPNPCSFYLLNLAIDVSLLSPAPSPSLYLPSSYL